MKFFVVVLSVVASAVASDYGGYGNGYGYVSFIKLEIFYIQWFLKNKMSK